MVMKAVEIKLSPQMQALLDDLPDSSFARMGTEFTPEEDDLIVVAYPKKNKEALAKVVGRNKYTGQIGCCTGTLVKHYKELCEQRGIEPVLTRAK